MSTGRVLAILLALLAGLAPAAAQDGVRLRAPDVLNGARLTTSSPDSAAGGGYGAVTQFDGRTAQQSNQQVIAPSMALRLALRYSPGSQGLDVTLVQGGRLMYAVKLKTGNRVHRVLVDARTGQILGE